MSPITANQNTSTQNHLVSYPNAATRNVELMARELSVFGQVSQAVKEMVLDEELTHAVEVLAAQEEAYAVVPRTFYKEGANLIDRHQQSLVAVLDGGIDAAERDLEDGTPGADWELERRQTERSNLDTIINMPAGTACIELSVPPVDKPEEERLAQHYNGLTMIRCSIKGHANPEKVVQYGFVLPVSSPEFIRALQLQLGLEPHDRINSQRLLANPKLIELDGSAEQTARQVDNLVGAALLESSVGHSAVRMIKRAVERRREAWDFVNSPEHQDLHDELLASMQYAALLSGEERVHAMAAIRTGFWKEFKDNFNGRARTAIVGSIISEAASRSVADGDVYIACGSTVTATEFSAKESVASRAQIADQLKREVSGSGTCQACGAKGTLYGCGVFCSRCNAKWCDEYKRSGKQLSPAELAHLSYSRPQTEAKNKSSEIFKAETFGEYWARLTREQKLKRLRQKQRLAEAA